MRLIAPSASLWYHWALTSAGMLFIYTSYKSGSLDVQHKLRQASWEITGCECVSRKTSTRNAGGTEHIWERNYYSENTLHQLYYSTCRYVTSSRETSQQIKPKRFLFGFFFSEAIASRSEFSFVSSLHFHCITLIKEDVRTKTGKSDSPYCTPHRPFCVRLALHPLSQTLYVYPSVLSSFHVVDKLCLAVPV